MFNPYVRHSLSCSGSEILPRHSLMRLPILTRHLRVCISCSFSVKPASGLSSNLRAFFTGRIFSLHCLYSNGKSLAYLEDLKRLFWMIDILNIKYIKCDYMNVVGISKIWSHWRIKFIRLQYVNSSMKLIIIDLHLTKFIKTNTTWMLFKSTNY